MHLRSVCINLLSQLKETSTSRDLARGKYLHAYALLHDLLSDVTISTSLINMYGKCGSLVNAILLIDRMPFLNTVSWNALLMGCVANGEVSSVLSYFSSMQAQGHVPNSRTYVPLLKAVNWNELSLEKTLAVHSLAEDSHLSDDIFLANTLIDLYGKCGNMPNAQAVFDKLSSKTNVVSWTALMLGYVDNGYPGTAFTLFLHMHLQGCHPNDRAFVAAAKACTALGADEPRGVKLAALNRGMAVHSQAAESSSDLDIFVGSTLVGMYGKLGSLVDARRVFDRLLKHDVVSWSALVLGYAEIGEGDMALKLFTCMGPRGDALTYVAALKGCFSLASQEEGVRVQGKVVKTSALERAMEVHSQALEERFESHAFVANTLVEVYLTCGSLLDARRVFDRVPVHDVVLWTSLIQGYAEHGEGVLALELFECFQRLQRLQPDALTYSTALKACSVIATNRKAEGVNFTLDCLEKGVDLHRRASEAGFGEHLLVQSSVLNMYSKCGGLVEAFRVSENISFQTVLVYNTLMLGCVEQGESFMALQTYSCMQLEGLRPNPATFVGVFKACAGVASQEDGKRKSWSLDKGRVYYEQAVECGCARESTVSCSAVDMFSKFGGLEDARRVFEDGSGGCVGAWNALMMGYVETDEPEKALELFSLMDSHCSPDGRTFVAAAKACICLAAKEGDVERTSLKERARSLHAQAERSGWGRDTFVASTFVELYSRCSCMEDAKRTFDKILSPSVVSWTVLMLGYAKCEKELEALELYKSYRSQGLLPNAVILGAGLKAACGGKTVAVRNAKQIYGEICRFGLEHVLGNPLVDCFGKLGSSNSSQEVFDWLPRRDASGWNSLIDAYGREGKAEGVLRIFESMQEEGVMPNRMTFASVLSALSHAGLVKEGMKVFRNMEERYGVYPDVQHYTSLVDLLGRGNQISSAMEVIQTMPHQPNDVVWRSLMGACRKWNNVEIGKVAFEALMKLEVKDAATYELMANIHLTSKEAVKP